jgi:hypothetical protein
MSAIAGVCVVAACLSATELPAPADGIDTRVADVVMAYRYMLRLEDQMEIVLYSGHLDLVSSKISFPLLERYEQAVAECNRAKDVAEASGTKIDIAWTCQSQ